MSPTTLLGKIEGRGEEGDRAWDGWMTSQIQWTGGRAATGKKKKKKVLCLYVQGRFSSLQLFATL